MNYYQKYLKYKQKYINLHIKIHGGDIDVLPDNLRDTLIEYPYRDRRKENEDRLCGKDFKNSYPKIIDFIISTLHTIKFINFVAFDCLLRPYLIENIINNLNNILDTYMPKISNGNENEKENCEKILTIIMTYIFNNINSLETYNLLKREFNKIDVKYTSNYKDFYINKIYKPFVSSAIVHNDIEIINLLIESDKLTPILDDVLKTAIKGSNKEIINLLIKSDKLKFTLDDVLETAIIRSNKEIINLLIKSDKLTSISDAVLQTAFRYSNKEIINLLIESDKLTSTSDSVLETTLNSWINLDTQIQIIKFLIQSPKLASISDAQFEKVIELELKHTDKYIKIIDLIIQSPKLASISDDLFEKVFEMNKTYPQKRSDILTLIIQSPKLASKILEKKIGYLDGYNILFIKKGVNKMREEMKKDKTKTTELKILDKKYKILHKKYPGL